MNIPSVQSELHNHQWYNYTEPSHWTDTSDDDKFIIIDDQNDLQKLLLILMKKFTAW